MSKLRLSKAILATKNYVVITDTINDGYVEPQYAEEFLEQIEPIVEHLKQLAREYTLTVQRGSKPNPQEYK